MSNLYKAYLLRLQKEIEIVVTVKTSLYVTYYSVTF